MPFTAIHRPSLALLAAVLCVSALSACGPDNTEISQTLEAEVAALPGVADVEHSYRRNDGTNGSKLELDVTMSPAATPQQIEEVIWRTYRAFRDHHDYDTPEATVWWGDATLEFGPASSEVSDEQIQDAAADAVERILGGEPYVEMKVERRAG